MNQFISFIRKEFLHIFRDSRTMLVLLLMPVVLICLFCYAVTNETKNSRVAIADESKSDAVRNITERINASPYFTVTHIVHNALVPLSLFALIFSLWAVLCYRKSAQSSVIAISLKTHYKSKRDEKVPSLF